MGRVMKLETIKKYLRPQKISGRRSTFSNAFASALASHDEYDRELVAQAINQLGQSPDDDLTCVYCDSQAATWDHLFKRVDAGEFSGYGHHIRNLVPCCRTCNESKGGKPWHEWIDKLSRPDAPARKSLIESYIAGGANQKVTLDEIQALAGEEIARYRDIRQQVFALLAEADAIANQIRGKLAAARK